MTLPIGSNRISWKPHQFCHVHIRQPYRLGQIGLVGNFWCRFWCRFWPYRLGQIGLVGNFGLVEIEAREPYRLGQIGLVGNPHDLSRS